MNLTNTIKSPRKLIEVALPLDSINAAAAHEKSIRHGHPSTLHLWWARRPLAAARAVVFAQMVNDPSWKWELEHPDEVPPNHLKASWASSRKRLFAILEDLVKWENTNNNEVLERGRTEIWKSWRETCELNANHPAASELFDPTRLPAFHDPFAGGGALPLEAQRLGLDAYATDLNPIAVLINKAMIEIPPRFAGAAPVNPALRAENSLIHPVWSGAEGLAADVRFYGDWIREQARNTLGQLYPSIMVTPEMAEGRADLAPLVGKTLTVVAWLWARTVKSSNPAFRHVDVPLASTFVVSSKKGRELYVQPTIDGDQYQFTLKAGTPTDDAKAGTVNRRGATCLLSKTPMPFSHIRAEAKAGRMGARLMAIVAEGDRGRVYISPAPEHERIANQARPAWKPETKLPDKALGFRVQEYGMATWADLFTPRQIVSLTTFADLVNQVVEKIAADALAAGYSNDNTSLDQGGRGAQAYAEAVAVYLAFAVSKLADRGSTICTWFTERDSTRNTFARQSIPMTWDYAELNTLLDGTGSFAGAVAWTAESIQGVAAGHGATFGAASQLDATTQNVSERKVISTDPPYYDNIGYADLSDFFYVWLRRALKPVFPQLFATVGVPKAEELVATPFRHGTREKAEAFFLDGMTHAMRRLAVMAHPFAPVTIYYAFKQSESETDSGTTSTGWETFLEAVLKAGFALTGTWPMRTELSNRMVGSGTNALASSIVLVCRPRSDGASAVSRRTFVRELNQVLPQALDEMTRGTGDDRSPVAPVDLSQAIIGPGMAVFSKYAAVLEADGTPMTVRTALQLINRFLAEDDFDHDTQFCLHWFEQHGWRDGKFGDADTLARAKGTSVDGVRQAGVLFASAGVVRLLKWSDYPVEWDPTTDPRLPVWEALHQTIRVFKTEGENAAGIVLAAIQAKAEATRQLAYRLYTLCERAGWAEDARAYNEIITSWSAIESAAAAAPTPQQTTLFG